MSWLQWGWIEPDKKDVPAPPAPLPPVAAALSAPEADTAMESPQLMRGSRLGRRGASESERK